MGKKIATRDKNLAQMATDFTSEVMGVRCATFLAEHYPWPRTKTIARDLDIAPATAKALLAGKPPSGAQIVALTRKFGARFHTYVFGPAIGWKSEAHMQERLEELRRETDRLARDLEELRALPEGVRHVPGANPPDASLKTEG